MLPSRGWVYYSSNSYIFLLNWSLCQQLMFFFDSCQSLKFTLYNVKYCYHSFFFKFLFEWNTFSLPLVSMCVCLESQVRFLLVQFSSSFVSNSATPCIEACQAFLSITNSWSFLKLMSIESVMPSSHLILCNPLLLPSIFSSIRVVSNESVLYIRWSVLQLQHPSFQ